MIKGKVIGSESSALFKVCKKCRSEWQDRDKFLNDPNIVLIGFMANKAQFDKGLYLFNHVLPDNSCNTTLGMAVSAFLDMYNGEVYEDLKMGTDECLGHCAKIEVIENCQAPCRNAVAREIMQSIIKLLPAHAK